MLQSRIRTQEEQAAYMKELKSWLAEAREIPAEGMADFFTARLDQYDDVHLRNWGEEYAHIADYFDEGLTTLLDIGCGTGLELDALYRRFPGLKITGVDLSADMLGRLREKYAGREIRLIQGDYFTCSFGEGGYDAALSFETLHHFPYEKKQAIYDRLYGVIRKGGCYIECDYIACCQEEEDLCLEGYRYRRERDGVPEDGFVHIDIPLTLEHQLELMGNAGFRKAKVLYRNGSTMVIGAEK